MTRIWDSGDRAWSQAESPKGLNEGVHFGQFNSESGLFALKNTDGKPEAWLFKNGRWRADSTLFEGLEAEGIPIQTGRPGKDNGFRLIDLNGDGMTEALILNPRLQAVFQWGRR